MTSACEDAQAGKRGWTRVGLGPLKASQASVALPTTPGLTWVPQADSWPQTPGKMVWPACIFGVAYLYPRPMTTQSFERLLSNKVVLFYQPVWIGMPWLIVLINLPGTVVGPPISDCKQSHYTANDGDWTGWWTQFHSTSHCTLIQTRLVSKSQPSLKQAQKDSCEFTVPGGLLKGKQISFASLGSFLEGFFFPSRKFANIRFQEQVTMRIWNVLLETECMQINVVYTFLPWQ